MRRQLVRALLPLVLTVPAVLAAQAPAVISGTVTLETGGVPVAGALVRIERLGVGTVSAADGRYRLVIPADRFAPGDSATLAVLRLGLGTQERRVALGGEMSGVDFRMAADALSLEAITVTAVTGAASRARERSDRGAEAGPGGYQREPGVLTAGILDDFSRGGWREYLRFVNRHRAEAGWNLDSRAVVRIRVRAGGEPLRDHPVVVRQGERQYTLRTRADGIVRLFPGLEHRLDAGEFTVTPEGGEPRRLVLTPALLRRGIVTVEQRAAASARPRPVLDIGLLIDATGSMQDEMSYLQTELRDIVQRVQPQGSPLEVRISVVYYRDRGDEFVTRPHPFDPDLGATERFLAATRADGGGDYPEEMNEALRVMMEQAWSGGPAARMLFVVADAPPHPYPDARYTFHDALTDATRKGISVFPVAASGADRPTEYLLRTMAVVTGGKYLFLTDDSGVGNPHLTPDQPFDVHRLNDLMVREIRAFVAGYYPELRGLAAR